MYHFFVDPDAVGEDEIRITGPDVNHIGHVLRMKPGEEVRLCTGQDSRDYRCRIDQITSEEVVCHILWVEERGTELPSEIVLFQGLPKSDKMEFIIQKAVELGASKIVPVNTRRCVVKLDAKKAANKVRRWTAISESAAKQSKRMIIPEIPEPVSYKEALKMAEQLDVVLIPYERAAGMEYTREVLSSVKPGQSVGIFIGPEGGFDEEEVQMAMDAGAHSITLGRRILRTETAGMTVIAALMIQLEEGGAGDAPATETEDIKE